MNWIDKYTKIKEDRVVVKLHDDDEKFIKSIIVPTEYYPLHNNRFKVFTNDNTELCKDEAILDVFDSITFEIGHCYTMNGALYDALISNGIDAKIWAGWLFVNGYETPVHHCWVTVGESVLDLSDDNYVKYVINGEAFKYVSSKKEHGELLVDFYAHIKKDKIPHRERCYPCGVPCAGMFYVGAECKSGDDARNFYRKLMKKFPNHECESNCNSDGTNETQRALCKAFGGKVRI